MHVATATDSDIYLSSTECERHSDKSGWMVADRRVREVPPHTYTVSDTLLFYIHVCMVPPAPVSERSAVGQATASRCFEVRDQL